MQIFENFDGIDLSKTIQTTFKTSYWFTLKMGSENKSISDLIDSMEATDNISFTYVPNKELSIGDDAREVQLDQDGIFYIKQGMHGSSGTWQKSNKVDAIDWLYNAALNNIEKFGSHENCYYRLNKANKNT